MRERARDRGRLEDIIEYSNNVSTFIEGVSFEEFQKDIRTYYSVMKNVEIVGEAAYMLSKAFKAAHPQTPWKVVQGMRHVLVHDYANIVLETLYDTAKNGIPELRQQVERYMSETDWAAWVAAEDAFDGFPDDISPETIETVRRMRANGMETKLIAHYVGLTEDEVEKID